MDPAVKRGTMKTILLIDDHKEFREIVSAMLLSAHYDVREASCPDEAFEALRGEIPDLIVCDLYMPFTMSDEMGDFEYSYQVGVKTVEELRWAIPEVPIIVASAAVPMDLEARTRHLEGVRTLSKPFSSATLLALVSALLPAGEQMTLH